MSSVPSVRIRDVNQLPVTGDGDYVLYWMVASRRPHWNYGLDRALEWCRELGRPLVVVEALRCGYQWASDRLHRFVLQGMADNRRRFRESSILYYPYVEPAPGDGTGMIEALAARASLVVTDDFPCFFLPRMIQTLGRRLSVRLEAVDSNGILPMRVADRVFARAYDFRRWLHKNLAPWLDEMPAEAPLRDYQGPVAELPDDVLRHWPAATDKMLSAEASVLSALPIDHWVSEASIDGGVAAAHRTLDRFLVDRFPRYADGRNDPDNEAASGLSAYLHFGHVSAHQIFARIVDEEVWNSGQLADDGRGAREGWWGMSPQAESFLDELITWRELGYNMCWQRDDYMEYESLPEWARRTLEEHAGDPRPHLYDLPELEAAATHDDVWNAAQRQLLTEGRIHNYLRMLWGKKILEWSPTPRDALAAMIELNNKYAVDGRNPNSYSGIFWVLGRYDRAWGPERPIFGKIRYMSSDNTTRKLKLKSYLSRYGMDASGSQPCEEQ